MASEAFRPLWRNLLLSTLAALTLAGAMVIVAFQLRNSIKLEKMNSEIRERQAELIMQSKMDAFADLVAGVAHEMDTPLGDSMSAMTTSEECTQIISEWAQAHQDNDLMKEDAQVARALTLLKENSRIVKEAGRRMAGLVASLEGFARLDQAEVQHLDVRAGLDNALALITGETKGKVNDTAPRFSTRWSSSLASSSTSPEPGKHTVHYWASIRLEAGSEIRPLPRNSRPYPHPPTAPLCES